MRPRSKDTALPRPEYLALSTLRPSPNNARTHSPRQIEQIARSIERFSFTNPILIDEKRRILAGHGRALAAKQLGLEFVPTLRIEHLSDIEKRAYVLADNKIAVNAGFDRELVAIELKALADLDFDLTLTGFESAEIDLIFEESGQTSDPSEPQGAIPAYQGRNATTQPGDLWLLGNHRLLCGDARDPAVFELLMANKKAEFAFTDPPYNVPIDGHVCGLGRVRHKNFAMGCGELTRPQFTSLLSGVFILMARHSIGGSIHQVCMDWRHIDEMLAAGRGAYSELKNVCIWNKNNAGMGSFYRSKHEMIFVWKNGKAPHINNFELGQHGRYRSNVWDYDGVNTPSPTRKRDLAIHPTVKPEALVIDAIKDCSRRNGLVLDPFAGSGTTILAAERTGRQARAIEIDPHYCDVAIQRWQAYSGKSAINAHSNYPFEAAGDIVVSRKERKR